MNWIEIDKVLNRQKALLMILQQVGGIASSVQMMKWAFLLSCETPSHGGKTFYQFIPYRYGPYSFTLNQETDSLIRNGYLEKGTDNHWRLTLLGESLDTTLPGDVSKEVNGIFALPPLSVRLRQCWCYSQQRCVNVIAFYVSWAIPGRLRGIWTVSDGDCRHTLLGHRDFVWCVAFHPEGTLFATGSADTTVKLWNVQDGVCLKTLVGHANAIRSLSFHSQGNLLASASEDGTIKLWDTDTGRCLKTLRSDRPYEGMEHQWHNRHHGGSKSHPPSVRSVCCCWWRLRTGGQTFWSVLPNGCEQFYRLK